MDPNQMGWIGGILGGVLGLLGGVFGTYCSLKGTKPGPERRLMIRWAVGFWIGVSAFIAGSFLLPEAYRWCLWIPYVPLLIWAINRCNRDLARIRKRSSLSSTNPRV